MMTEEEYWHGKKGEMTREETIEYERLQAIIYAPHPDTGRPLTEFEIKQIIRNSRFPKKMAKKFRGIVYDAYDPEGHRKAKAEQVKMRF